MPTFETVRLQVALLGRVTDARTGAPLPGARVEIQSGPAAWTRAQQFLAVAHGPGFQALPQRPGRTVTGADGAWHLADLPPGAYMLAFSLPAEGARWGTATAGAQVQPRQGGGVVPATVDAALPPTRLEGRVTRPGGDPVAAAEVSLRGSTERTRTGTDGRWTLAAVEPGARQVRIAARGFLLATRDVTLATGAAQTVDVQLAPA